VGFEELEEAALSGLEPAVGLPSAAVEKYEILFSSYVR
jgi:hypothetical protein